MWHSGLDRALRAQLKKIGEDDSGVAFLVRNHSRFRITFVPKPCVVLVEQASVGGRRIGGVRSRQLRPRPRPGMQSPSRRNLWSLTKTTFCAANQKSVAKIAPTTFSWLMSQAGKETGSSAAWLQDVLMNSVSGGKSPCQVCSMHRAGCAVLQLQVERSNTGMDIFGEVVLSSVFS